MIDIWSKLHNRISQKQKTRILHFYSRRPKVLHASLTTVLPSLISSVFMQACWLMSWLAVAFVFLFFSCCFFSSSEGLSVLILKAKQVILSGKLQSIRLHLEDSERGNNRVEKQKQRLAFIPLLHRFLMGAFLLLKSQPTRYNTHSVCMHGCTHS